MTRGGTLFIGEAPGAQEEKFGHIFVGKTGEEVDGHYLPTAGLRRDTSSFTNAIACYPPTPKGKLDPTKQAHLDLLTACAECHLYPLIERMQPRVLVPMGQFACRAIYGEAFDLDLKHGIPTESPWGPTFPMYHPALGLHEPKKMLYIRTDWHRLRKFLNGTLYQPVDAYPEPDYAEVTDVSEIQECDPTRPLAADTESGRDGAFCLTYSQRPGTGRLIRADRPDLISALQAQLLHWESAILFHNWLYDWPIVEAMGLHFDYRRVVDTMARVAHLGNLPQGLKALAFRELGMTMQDFDDVVTPHSKQRVLEYYWAAYAETWEKPEPQLVRGDEGKWKLYKPQGFNTKLKRFFTDLRKNPDKDVFSMWEDNWTDAQQMVEERLGPWPGKDIRHAPFEDAMWYACRDADATLRLWNVIRKMGTQVRRYSQEVWRERAA